MKYVVIGICSLTMMSVSLAVPAAHAASFAVDWNTEGSAARSPSSPGSPSVNTTITTSVTASGGGASLAGIFNFGTGGSGGAHSGGAPSPEVDAAIGLLLAASTVAFLRRRRTGVAGSRG